MDGPSDLGALAESLYSDLQLLRKGIKKTYPEPKQQVGSQSIRASAKAAAEAWLVDLAGRALARESLDADLFASLSVDFEALHQASAHSTTRKVYDGLLKKILERFQLDVVIPLKRLRSTSMATPPRPRTMIQATSNVPTVFVGHSFATEDSSICGAVVGVLRAVGLQVFTGERPRADRVSDKVKELIDSQDVFVGVFTRRDKIKGRSEWTTTTWVIEEKTWAIAKNKRLLLLREEGVKNLGGMHADHEYIEFRRDTFGLAIVKLLEAFRIDALGLR